MKRTTLIFLFVVAVFLSLATCLNAQNQSYNIAPFSESERVITKSLPNLYLSTDSSLANRAIAVYADERLNEMLEISKEENKRNNGIPGFRVQVYQGDKDRAYETKAEFLRNHPDYDVYVLFKTPDFRVRVGDCRTRSEAIKIKYLIEKDFPNSFIVEDIINFPKLKTE